MPVSIRQFITDSGSGRSINIRPWVFPLGFVLLSLLVYWPTRDAGFVMDWLGWQYAYDRDGWAGIPTSYGYPGLHPVLHLGNYTLYWLFGANSPVWYAVFATLHGLNAWLLCRLAMRLPLKIQVKQQLFIAAGASLLFLFSPYAAEVVVWRVCFHYLLALLFAMLAMHRTLDYLGNPKRRYWWQIQLYVLLALFTFEWSLVIPGLLFALTLVYIFSKNTSEADSKLKTSASAKASVDRQKLLLRQGSGGQAKLLLRLFLPQVCLWAFYFLINKIRLGDWVGHYGAETHLHIAPADMFSNMLRYLVKQFGFVRHWGAPLEPQLFDGLAGGWMFWTGVGLTAVAAVFWLIYFRKIPARLQWAGGAFAWFFIALAPVSNLYFYYLQFGENDRYGYFASGFGWLALLLLLSFLPKFLFRLITLALVGLSLCLLLQMNSYWAISERVYDSLVDDFRWYDRDEVIILASPDNYRGIFMFRIIGQVNGFNEALELRRRRPFKGKMWEAAQFNINSPDYGLRVDRDSSGLLYKFSFLHDGSWWWRNGIGATEYENDRYVFRKKQWHVEIELKEKRPNTAIISPVGGHWIEIK